MISFPDSVLGNRVVSCALFAHILQLP
uniref:Uncharacterized protein n=1 Tax=Arundo donax TaxID=35708 RepID=A0A0A8YFX0_ARUDO